MDVVQLAASETAFVAIREDGALFTWGDSKIPDVEQPGFDWSRMGLCRSRRKPMKTTTT